ncbi:MAG: UDP-N-acetylmuramoyl-L-alanine--D-glutamate ligase [Rhodospirillales bacterium]|nr:UDP-N-acetylmuramoyl-L-alanine--D-glutamate ligase [Rhodospirillales bacterium]
MVIEVNSFSGETVAVMGLARSGLAAARALKAGGAEVLAWDDAPQMRDAAQLEGAQITDLTSCDWRGIRALVLSPGIADRFPEPNPVAALAREQGCAIICDVDLLAQTETDATYIGITGTNGKSTTTALIGHILDSVGMPAQIGGNLGVPVLDLEPLGAGGTYVLELSSYQLERTPSLRLNVAVLLNISPDHLDRHGGLQGYVAAKRMMFDNPGEAAHAIIGMEDAHCRGICMELMVAGGWKIVPVSGSARTAGGVYVVGGVLVDDLDYSQTVIGDLKSITSLPGRHNWQNAAAAAAAARIAGVPADKLMGAIETFTGLPHRQELVCVIGDVYYINDSKATNTEATSQALATYNAVHWIAGGEFKEENLDALAPYLDHIKGAYLIGASAARFEAELAGRVKSLNCGDLASAVNAAHQAAQAAGAPSAVLLSPAAASFDQFDNFEARGDVFRNLVQELKEAQI